MDVHSTSFFNYIPPTEELQMLIQSHGLQGIEELFQKALEKAGYPDSNPRLVWRKFPADVVRFAVIAILGNTEREFIKFEGRWVSPNYCKLNLQEGTLEFFNSDYFEEARYFFRYSTRYFFRYSTPKDL